MTQFDIAIKTTETITCDICGATMLPLHGGHWDNDRIICTDRQCGAEIIYPTSTAAPGSADEEEQTP